MLLLPKHTTSTLSTRLCRPIKRDFPSKFVVLSLPFFLMLTAMFPMAAASQDILNDISFLGGIQDRSAGTVGSDQAADYILKSFEAAGLSEIGVQKFLIPVPEVLSASLELEGLNIDIHPWGPNLVYLPMTPKEGIRGPIVYAADGELERFNGSTIKDSIVLMDMRSRGNWMNAASLGASALIFLGDEDSVSGEFQEKTTPTPVAFPRFWVSPGDGKKLKSLLSQQAVQGKVLCRTRWQNKVIQNCYALLPGKNPQLRNEIVVLDAFYDASSYVLGVAPGADEATSTGMLLTLARQMAKDPPERSVLFLASGGNGQSLAGMRHFVWALTARKKTLRKETKDLDEQKTRTDFQIQLLEQNPDPFSLTSPQDREAMLQLLVEKAKDKADILTRAVQYQNVLQKGQSTVKKEEPKPYRRLSWLTRLEDISPEQVPLVSELLGDAMMELRAKHKELKVRQQALKSSTALRNLLDDYRPILFLSLHLSSHSPYMGLVEMGQTYPIRESIKRMTRATRLINLMNQTASEVVSLTGLPRLIRDTSRGSALQESAGRSGSIFRPCCDVSAVAGQPAASLITLDDYQSRWSTPHDTLDRLDKSNVQTISRFLPPLLTRIISHPSLHLCCESGISGIASLEGRAMFTRQGELFPDQPAPGTIISVLHKDTVFRGMVYRDGTFFIPGLANNRVALEKLILEPYGLDPETGRVAWAADKVQTGKVNYRIKAKTDLVSSSLVMFHCLQTDIIHTFNPNNMGFLTKAELLDASSESTPLRYWFSRVDGRNTMSTSVFLEEGTRFKLVMAESLLGKEFFLLNSSAEDSMGKGFLIADPPTITSAPHQVAKDLRILVGQRLKNLFQHGIVNKHLETLYQSSSRDLQESEKHLAQNEYDRFWNKVIPAWARLDIVYAEVERNQRDVLAGVMFFIALFVPFAHCMERYLFAFRGIYQQITAFFIILLMTIFTIRALHPAFELTYSPMVVIVAFFIVGLSLLVSWIIFVRFEEQMADIESRASHVKTPEANKWQAFGAGFSIGVSNLNRRKLRTGLTCLTLIILTFTVMSFTNVKSLHKTTNTQIASTTPYEGILLRNQFRSPLTQLTLEDARCRFAGLGTVMPRGWIEPLSSARNIATVYHGDRHYAAEGVLGMGANPPEYIRSILKSGDWFSEIEEDAILLPLTMAKSLGLNPEKDIGVQIQLMGTQVRVLGYFDGDLLDSLRDLDQEPIVPAYREVGQSEELSEVEAEAIQSGEEILPQSQRFRYANGKNTIILPFDRCSKFGGTLKVVTILPRPGAAPLELAEQLSSWMVLPLFVGENGIWYHSAGSILRYQGVANLLVPILIVVLITLNTMIGHVHERHREIGTYTSVGLAPTHVGFLFIVEALSLAVISTVIGYILAQFSAKYLGNTSLFSQLTFNYSSLASVACMFLVFSVVFLASLYPARMASRIAMPDVNLSWALPEPEGDALLINLPFLYKQEEEKGIMGFLNAFYISHQDVGQGTFIADETKLNVDAPEVRPGMIPVPLCLLIRTNVWLEPYDFGIKQRIQLHCCPSQANPGYLEIAVRMIRISGERSAWARANRNFIKGLRKRLLLWRFLDSAARAHYSQIPFDYSSQSEDVLL